MPAYSGVKAVGTIGGIEITTLWCQLPHPSSLGLTASLVEGEACP